MNLREYRANRKNDSGLEETRKQLDLHIRFSEAVIRARIEKGISQATLARLVGTRQANISRIEAGIANPTLNLINKIVKALQIEIAFHHPIVQEQGSGQILVGRSSGKGNQKDRTAARNRLKKLEHVQ